ncbi:MAG: alpha-glucan family phosphorylase [Desulfobacterales bacterium]
MSYLQTFQVFPNVPQQLAPTQKITRNLWWCWHLDAIELFRRLNPGIWRDSGQNPILFASMISQAQLEEQAKDESFLAHQKRVWTLFEKDVLDPVDYSNSPFKRENSIAYFSMEFGIHESLPLFAGGLGVLAGDHLKAASDMKIPLVGIGLFYRRGYFHQYLDVEGWQQEEYPETDIYHVPAERAKDASGNEVHVSIEGPDGTIRAMVWKIKVGRISLFLLDTNLPENTPEIREITAQLYSSASKTRLAQEVLLGIGGMRALEIMGIQPVVCHMNEGHCAFASIERLAQTVENYKIDLKIAHEVVARSTVFTTHTPVAAGHDEFPVDLVRPYVAPFQERLGVSVDEIISWGQSGGIRAITPLSMFVLALRMSQYHNGVSELHGKVARKMWSHVWPGHPDEEVPISHITNGVHIPSWISIENSMLFDRYLGPGWEMKTEDPELMSRVDGIYEEELWRSHELSRTRLIRACRSLMVRQYGRRNASKVMMKEAESVLDQGALTIAFARRFATYKRANLLLHDPKRFEKILTSTEYPVQFIFAGKAHPRDNEGKELIKRLIQFARDPDLRHRIVFLEDYNIDIARRLVQGADIWLNTPRRPLEACGTSGIKAAANGVLNVSILDGWWCEGYSEEAGWRIGNGEEYDDHHFQDAIESQALYNLLENDVIPCFYDRRDGDVPEKWMKMMKASIKTAMKNFSALKMVKQYNERFYLPAAERTHELLANDAEEAKELNLFRERLNANWSEIKIDRPVRNMEGPFRVGSSFSVAAEVTLGKLRPDEVDVELYYGNIKTIDTVSKAYIEKMSVKEDRGSGIYLYECAVNCKWPGRFGFTARVVPKGDDMIRFTPGFITWA